MTTTRNDDWHFADDLPRRYRTTLDATVPASNLETLNEQVVERARMHDAAENGRTHAPSAHPMLSRRRLVALGVSVTALAGVGLLGLGPLLTAPGSEQGSDTTGAASPAFGLAVAYAAENASASAAPRATTFELAATDGGLVPLVTQGAHTTLLRLDLAVVGDHIAELTYGIITPVDATPSPAWDAGTQQMARPALGFQEHTRMADLDAIATPYRTGFTSYRAIVHNGLAPRTDSFTVGADDLVWVGEREQAPRSSAAAEGVGDDESARGTYWLLVADTPDSLWRDDTVLSRYQNYVQARALLEQTRREAPWDEGGLTMCEANCENAAGLLSLAVGRMLSDAAATRDWMRERYVENLRLVAETLSRSTLSVHASFDDGRRPAACAYRIEPIDGFDEAATARFDALYELANPTFVPLEEMSADIQAFAREGAARAGELGIDPDPLDGWYVLHGTDPGSASGLSSSELPYLTTIEGEPNPAVDDPRLRTPLFTITDISGAVFLG